MRRTVVRVSLGERVVAGFTICADGYIIAISPQLHGAEEREVLIAVDGVIERRERGDQPPVGGMDIVPCRRSTDTPHLRSIA